MSEFQPPTLRQRAAAVSDLASDCALGSEKLGYLDPDIVQAMQDMNLPQLLKHGSMSTIKEFVDVCGILAEGDMSTGWCNFLWGIHNYLVGLYPDAIHEKVWQNPKTLISGSLGPFGETDRVSTDGAVITGRWPSVAGCDHADWLLLGLREKDGESYLALVHSSDLELRDTSHALGLRGAGSKDAICSSLHIPADRLMPASMTLVPYGALLILVIVGPLIGGAQAAVGEFRKKLSSSADQSLLLQLAEASAEVDTARTLVLVDADILDVNPAPNPFITARILRDTVFAARLCNQATGRLFRASGSSELHTGSTFQRIFRDVTAACGHSRLQWEGQSLPYAHMLVGT
ncbi:MAG: hypothetical protein ACJ0Q6_06955 [Candidatus Azotimanducaceae bacterium]|uniref:Acyl-CoA dehydrogenase C-terminal domain-containing protein n=1 Tax=OM182 bacterium TaxID=2510334 RepID=A0A520S3B7_9GAMM|nr:hypothetical protein [Gammaproteobacteria bacterium]RZO76965.1 MAG: hypothetical protein EVA68_02795 [OM182 bacterium]